MPEQDKAERRLRELEEAIRALQRRIVVPGGKAGDVLVRRFGRPYGAAWEVVSVPERTRRIWVPARDFQAVLGAPTYGASGTWGNVASYWLLRNAYDDGVVGHTMLPSDWKSGTVTPYVLYQGQGTGYFYVTAQGAAITPNDTESMFQTGDDAQTQQIYSYNNAYLATFPNVAITVAAGDFLNLGVRRQGAHASDTSSNNMYLYGVVLEYTADY